MHLSTKFRTAAVAVAASAFLTLMAFPVSIQVQQQQPPELSDSKIQAVAEAYVQVFEIQSAYAPRIEAAQSPEEAQQLQQRANEEVVEVIREQEGVTVEEYSQIVNLAQSDEQVRERLLKEIQKIQEEDESQEPNRR